MALASYVSRANPTPAYCALFNDFETRLQRATSPAPLLRVIDYPRHTARRLMPSPSRSPNNRSIDYSGNGSGGRPGFPV